MRRIAICAIFGVMLAPLAGTCAQGPAAAKPASKQKLQTRSRLEIVRYVAGEFARAVRPLPTGKKGFRIRVGAPVNESALAMAAAQGVAGRPGDNVQITQIEFRKKELLVHINGGGKKRRNWRDRITISAGGGIPTSTTTSNVPGYQPIGSTLILEFGAPVPDLTADELKALLKDFLDFSKQRSATVAWVETLAPEFQQAIKDRRAVVGMDREMVVAAMGKPERKVRERDPEGLETEDWIYGHPPSKTVFVKFAGEKVISVKQFPA